MRSMTLTAARGLAALAGLTLLAGCPGTTVIRELEPRFIADPDPITFGTVQGGVVATQEVLIFNAGQQSGEIYDLQLEGAHPELAFFWEDDDPEDPSVGRILERGSGFSVTVQWQPYEDTPLADVLVVSTSLDEDLRVDITGSPNIEPIPDIDVEPDIWDAGSVEFENPVVQNFRVSNNGWAPLDVGQVVVTGTGAGHFQVLVNEVSWNTLDVGEHGWIQLAFDPVADGFFEANLEIHSVSPGMDPDENPFVIPVSGRGNGAPDPKPPVAICGADQTVFPLTTVFLDGSMSFDPSGFEPLNYDWSLVGAPLGSSVTLSNTDSISPTLVADLAGEYIAELYVTNTIGVRSTEPCQTTLNVIPAEDMRVELYWDEPEDIDLHVLRFEGAEVGGDDDCWALNCSPTHTLVDLDWWTPGIGPEDPSQDLDDNDGMGTGPENTNIVTPFPSNYAVVVHDFPSPTPIPTFVGTNTVHVRIWLGGAVAGEYTWEMTGDDTCYEPVIIDWPSTPAERPSLRPGRGDIGFCLPDPFGVR